MRKKFPKKNELVVWAVDDDEINLDIMQDMLSQIGVCHVRLEQDGRALLRSLQSEAAQPHIIIADLYMPDFDGIELVSKLIGLKFSGGLIMVSGVNVDMLWLAQQLARDNGLKVLAAWEKPLALAALAPVIDSQCADTLAAPL